MNNKPLIWAVIAFAVLGGIAAWYYPRIDQFSDIFFYQKIAEDVVSVRVGNAPGEASAWYPPFAAAVFYVISLVPHFSFVQSWLGTVIGVAVAGWAYLYFVLKQKHAYVLPLTLIANVFLIGINVTFARYDVLIGLLIILAWQAHRSKKYAMSVAFAILAGGLKAVPFVILPLIILTIPKEKWRSTVIGLVLGFVLMLGLPAVVVGPKNSIETARSFLSFQGERGFQIESTASGIDMFAKNVFHQQAYAAFHHFATHNMDLGRTALRVSTALVILGVIALFVRIQRDKERETRDIALIIASGILVVLFFAPVFSPQFLMWVMPLMFMWLGEKFVRDQRVSRKVVPAAVLVGVIAFATQWIYPFHYRDFFEQTYLFNTIMLNVRNFAILGLLLWCLRAIGINLRVPRFTVPESAPLSRGQKKFVTYIMLAVVIAFITYICSFKILDRDFWWHIKAGEIMTQTRQLIQLDPFAYTREGKPYLATQSWLAEILLYDIYRIGGTNGIIIFRTLTMLFIFGLLLSIDKKRIWLNGLLVIFAANLAQPAFIERPQLFTFSIFALFLYFAFQALEKGLTRKLAIIFIALEVLWVNMHGAASLLGLGVVGALALQDWYTKRAWSRQWLYLVGGVFVALFASPATYHNVTYIFTLLSDKTIIFINEWQPRELALYLAEFSIIWAAALWALWNTRRNWVYCVIMLVATGVMSRQALRHEVLFVFTALGITFYQLKYSSAYERFAQYLMRRQVAAVVLLGVSCAGLFHYTRGHYHRFAQEDQLFGYGVFAPAKGAYEFIEKNNVQGRMFNTYGIGGYLMYRGYPNRKVYIDGRNVDYGYEFMNETYQGGLDAESWKKLEDTYGLTYAVIDYSAIANVGRAGYSVHLDKNPNWPLVYLDDWAAIYMKNTPENQAIINNKKYSILNPINFDKGEVLDTVTVSNKEALREELKRVVESNSDGVKAKLLLARLHIADNEPQKARELLGEVKNTQPHLADTYQLLASIALKEQQWIEAAGQYKRMLANTGDAYPNINYNAIADVFSKAGYWFDAAFYRWLATPVLDMNTVSQQKQESASSEKSSENGPITQDMIGSLLSGIGEDIKNSNDRGVDLAKEQKFEEAKEQFLNALKLDPGNSQTLNNLGALSMQVGDPKAALDYLNRSLERTPKYADAHYNLAIVYYNQKNYTEALKEAKLSQEYGRNSKDFIVEIQNKLK